MKKIGILFGMEDTFPWALIDRINAKNIEGVEAGAVTVDQVLQGEATEYAVIIDRISQDVPFYRAYLKNAAISGTAVINNPFWWSADEKFFNNALAKKIGVPVPKTVLLPSKERPDDTSDKSFRNLKFPLSWDAIFDHIGFPAFMKPHSGGGWKSVYKLENKEEFFKAYGETGQLVMMLQEAVEFDDYYRCYCLGGEVVHIMPYAPKNPHHLRYDATTNATPELLATIEQYVKDLNKALGYDFNTVEFAIRDGIPLAIDFCNPAPDADVNSVGVENFEWIIENAANMAIERALAHDWDKDNLTWGTFIKNAAGATTQSTTKAGILAAKVLSGMEGQLEGEIGKALAKLDDEQVAIVMEDESIEEFVEEAVEEVIEEIEELFEVEEEENELVELKIEPIVIDDGVPTTFNEETRQEEIIENIILIEVQKQREKANEATTKQQELNSINAGTTSEGLSTLYDIDAASTGQTTLFNTIGTATEAEKDDLKAIKGVGPKLESVLNKLGIFTFAQVSKMTDIEYALVDDLMTAFKGRGKRDDWAGQAAKLIK